MLSLRYIILTKLFSLLYLCKANQITYLSVEHATVTYTNPRYVGYAIVTARRYSRRDPVYYFNLKFEALDGFGRNLSVDIYFYEWLTNVYKPSFIEMHFNACDLVHKDLFFGPGLKQGKLKQPCPWEKGVYDLVNMTVPDAAIPRGFPFTKGRIIANVSVSKELVGSGYVDMELKKKH